MFPVAGTVATVDVAVGDTVAVGTPLASLDTADLEQDLRQRQDDLATAELVLATAENGEDPSSISGGGGVLAAFTSESAGNLFELTVYTEDLQVEAATRKATAEPATTGDPSTAAAPPATEPTTTPTPTTAAPTTTAPSSGPSTTDGPPATEPTATTPTTTTPTTPTTVPPTAETTAPSTTSPTVSEPTTPATGSTGTPTTTTPSEPTPPPTSSTVPSGNQPGGTTPGGAQPGGGGGPTGGARPSGSGGGGGGGLGTGGVGARTPTDADIASYQAAVDAATVQLQVAEQAIAQATVVSPISGTVTAVNIDVGTAVDSGSATDTIVIEGPGGYEAHTTIGIDDIDEVAVGDAATLTPDGADTGLDGQVVAVATVPDDTTSSTSFSVTVSLDGDTSSLRNGSVGTIELVTGSADATVAVPTSAVTPANGRYTVTVLDADGRATETAVQVGVVGSTWTEITAGLTVGQTVVLADLDAAIVNDQINSGSPPGFPTFPGRFTT